VTDLGGDPLHPTVFGQPFDAVVVADGGWSTLRQLITGNAKQPEYAGHAIYRAKCTVPDFEDAYGAFVGEGAHMVSRYWWPDLDGEVYI
jgi:2-polyprenyl-6-methoxyphenol hydroxylase-like FAD-dependent oxidoreductase